MNIVETGFPFQHFLPWWWQLLYVVANDTFLRNVNFLSGSRFKCAYILIYTSYDGVGGEGVGVLINQAGQREEKIPTID